MTLLDAKLTANNIIAEDELSVKITQLDIDQRDKNLITDDIYIDGKYLNKSGIEIVNATSKCTDFIMLGNRQIFTVTAYQKFSSPAGICLYNKDKTCLKSFGYSTLSNLISKKYTLSNDVFYGSDILKEYPSAAYIRFSSYMNGLSVSAKQQEPSIQNDIDATIEKNKEQQIYGTFADDSSLSIIIGAWVRGQFSDDAFIANSTNGEYVDFVEIKHGDKYKVSGHSNGSAAIYAIYNEGRQGLYAFIAGSGKTLNVYGMDVDCDEILQNYPTAKYIMFGTFNSSVVPLSVKKFKKYAIDNFMTTQLGYSDIVNINKYNSYIGKSDGKNSTPMNAIATSYVKIDENSKFIVSLAYQQSSCGCACYDENYLFLGSIYKSESGDVEQHYIINEKLTGKQILELFPTTKYIRFSSLNTITFNPRFKMLQQLTLQQIAEKQQEILDTLSASNPLYGKTWIACGDSFTNMNFNDYVDISGNVGLSSDGYDRDYRLYKTYPTVIAANNKMHLINAAASGMKSFLTAYSDNTSSFYQKVATLSNEISSADYMTLMFGLNDSGPVGTSADTDPTTMCGAWNNILSTILSCNPSIKIGIISPDGWLSENLRNAQSVIGKAWGIPVLDLKSENIPFQTGSRPYDMNPYAVSQRNSVMQIGSGSTHPSILGQQYRSTVIQNFMKSL